ncbi:hypothetical protein D3C81_1932210 [compost metagenome]
MRVPGGTFVMPSLSVTSWMYSLEVAQVTNDLAASLCLEVAGIANDQAYNHEDPLSVTSIGAGAKPTLSTTRLCSLSVVKDPATLASTQIAHFPLLKRASVSLNPLLDTPGGPYFLRVST